MKVKCIDNDNSFNSLTIGKIYSVNEETEESYYILNDKNKIIKYVKDRFKVVEEDNKMKVKCIDDKTIEEFITKGKVYLLERETEDSYKIIDDKDERHYYSKYRFIKVPEVNEVSESIIVNIAKEIGQLVEKKDKDYNSAFSKTLKEYGNVAYFLRLDDKLNRLKNLMLNNNNAEVNESVEDTLKDIIGYTILMLKEIKSSFYKG